MKITNFGRNRSDVNESANVPHRPYALLRARRARRALVNTRVVHYTLTKKSFSMQFLCCPEKNYFNGLGMFANSGLPLESIDFINDAAAKTLYDRKFLLTFYKALNSDRLMLYSGVRTFEAQFISIFDSTYVCEQFFSLVNLKTKTKYVSGRQHSLKCAKGKRGRPACTVVQQEEVESIPASSYECTMVYCVFRGNELFIYYIVYNSLTYCELSIVLISAIMVLTTEEKVFIIEHYFRSYGVERQNGPNLRHVKEQNQKQFNNVVPNNTTKRRREVPSYGISFMSSCML
ncbi:hypothetical protein ANN_22177 [Periplaneta americana]|uniref:Protein FAR1-RELATED SEQUENCE n=1 Tax=Periplaneta americana TaxID=6978 RepID=A0ABQ8S7F1_PERAM|nr:hypothetical protein ANN_22177 [Periplaneta americana]